MLGFTVRSLGTLPIHTPFVHNGTDMLKVPHPVYGFAARTGDGQTVVLTSKTPVHVAEKARVRGDAAAMVEEVNRLQRMRS